MPQSSTPTDRPEFRGLTSNLDWRPRLVPPDEVSETPALGTGLLTAYSMDRPVDRPARLAVAAQAWSLVAIDGEPS